MTSSSSSQLLRGRGGWPCQTGRGGRGLIHSLADAILGGEMDAYDSDSAGSGVIDLEAPEWANTNGVGGGSRANNAGARRPKKRSNWRGDPGVDKRKGGAKKKPRNESGVAEPDVEVQSDFSSWRKKGPPPTITFSTALGMETPEHWMTKQVNGLSSCIVLGCSPPPITFACEEKGWC